MVRLSVNVNKIATLRNARGTDQPNLLSVVKDLISFGVRGITVHPRPDKRHILYEDVRAIQNVLQKEDVEFNVEGTPNPVFLKLLQEVKPHQCTLVPDGPNVLTSESGWNFQSQFNILQETLNFLRQQNIRSSVFLDPFTFDEKEQEALSLLKPDRAELYTKAYADSFHTAQRQKITHVYHSVGDKVQNLGIALNAGHDLNRENLTFFLKSVTGIQEVSIGHALICEALYEGLEKVCKDYLRICNL